MHKFMKNWYEFMNSEFKKNICKVEMAKFNQKGLSVSAVSLYFIEITLSNTCQ
jgi:hypothetical protein